MEWLKASHRSLPHPERHLDPEEAVLSEIAVRRTAIDYAEADAAQGSFRARLLLPRAWSELRHYVRTARSDPRGPSDQSIARILGVPVASLPGGEPVSRAS